MLKRLVQVLFLAPGLGFFLWWKLAALASGRTRAFMGVSQFLALWPGLPGVWLRAAFYRLALPESSQNTVIEFLTVFSSPDAALGRHVSIGSGCTIGRAVIGDHCILGSHISVTSGRRQHGFADPATPIRLQEGARETVAIGRDCWIGNAAVIAADVGEGSVVAAGSTVVHPVEPFSVVAGNPAKAVGRRGPGPQRNAAGEGADACGPA